MEIKCTCGRRLKHVEYYFEGSRFYKPCECRDIRDVLETVITDCKRVSESLQSLQSALEDWYD
jgi:hypothetical protein